MTTEGKPRAKARCPQRQHAYCSNANRWYTLRSHLTHDVGWGDAVTHAAFVDDFCSAFRGLKCAVGGSSNLSLLVLPDHGSLNVVSSSHVPGEYEGESENECQDQEGGGGEASNTAC